MHLFLQTFFNPAELLKAFPVLLTEGLRNTLLIAGLAIVFGSVLGVLLAMLLLSHRRLVRLPARVYVDTDRKSVV